MKSDYCIRSFDLADRTSLEHLYHAVYGDVWREKTNLGWTLDEPLAEAGAMIAVSGECVVAAQPYCDLPLHTPWGAQRATLFLDVATHPGHQRRGLFARTVEAARRAAFGRGTCIVMTTPNRIAALGFQGMSGWTQLCSLDCFFYPLGAGDAVPGGGPVSIGARLALAALSRAQDVITGRISPSVSSHSGVETPWQPTSDADALWSRAATRTMVARNRRFLQWRFGPPYRLFFAGGPGDALGYTVARIVNRDGVKVGMVLDCLTAGNGAITGRLLTSMAAWLRDQGASVAVGYFLPGTPLYQCARKAGFLRVPRAWVPRDYPIFVSIRPEDPHTPELLDASSWHITLADSDLV